jgi:uncharacterized membrane protein YebE (DUF533 family)
MNASSLLINAVLGGVLGGGRKQTRNARRYLGRAGGSALMNPSTLLTAAGLAWGVFETLQQSGAPGAAASVAGAGAAAGSWTGAAAPPPVPSVSPDRVPAASASPPESTSEVSPQALRVVRLAISAANADGAMHDRERESVIARAREAGLAELVERELAQPRPLREIVAGVATRDEAATLYVLAFTVLRADETVLPTERVFLAQLASLLGLDKSTVDALERDTGARIDASGERS